MNKIRIESYVEAEEIIEAIYDSVSHEDIPAFIMQLEQYYENWDVSFEVLKLYLKQHLSMEDEGYRIKDALKEIGYEE